MIFNKTHLEHSIITIILFFVIYLLTWNALAASIIGSTAFISREYTQAEKRWAIKYNKGSPYGFFTKGFLKSDSWNLDSYLDFIIPVVISIILYMYFS